MRKPFDPNKLSQEGVKLLKSLDHLKKIMRVSPKKKIDYTMSKRYEAFMDKQKKKKSVHNRLAVPKNIPLKKESSVIQLD